MDSKQLGATLERLKGIQASFESQFAEKAQVYSAMLFLQRHRGTLNLIPGLKLEKLAWNFFPLNVIGN
jgi:hypothetical protein